MSRANCNLRLWQPGRGAVTMMALDVAPLCVLYADGILVVGHEHGLTALSVETTVIQERQ